MRFIGPAYISPATADTDPDAYLCIDSDETVGVVIRLGSKDRIEDLQELAAALNEWADTI